MEKAEKKVDSPGVNAMLDKFIWVPITYYLLVLLEFFTSSVVNNQYILSVTESCTLLKNALLNYLLGSMEHETHTHALQHEWLAVPTHCNASSGCPW